MAKQSKQAEAIPAAAVEPKFNMNSYVSRLVDVLLARAIDRGAKLNVGQIVQQRLARSPMPIADKLAAELVEASKLTGEPLMVVSAERIARDVAYVTTLPSCVAVDAGNNVVSLTARRATQAGGKLADAHIAAYDAKLAKPAKPAAKRNRKS
jgi:hypothetical protein